MLYENYYFKNVKNNKNKLILKLYFIDNNLICFKDVFSINNIK